MDDAEQIELSRQLLIDQIGNLHVYHNNFEFDKLVELICQIHSNLSLYQQGHGARLKDQNLQNQINENVSRCADRLKEKITVICTNENDFYHFAYELRKYDAHDKFTRELL